MKNILNPYRVLPLFTGFLFLFLMTTAGCAPRYGCNYTTNTKPILPEVMTMQWLSAVDNDCLIGL